MACAWRLIYTGQIEDVSTTLQNPSMPSIQIKEELKRAGLTQRALAKALGISEFRISRVLGGRFLARPRERRRIAGLLGVPVSKLFRRQRRA